MGRLAQRTEVNELWSFMDACKGRKEVYYEWPNLQYPHIVAMHQTDLTNKLKVSINEWIEDTLTDTVIYDMHDKSYRTVDKKTDLWNQWDHSRFISNIWVNFYFRKEESLLAFALKFGEFIKPITGYSPKYGPIPESDMILR